MSIENTALWDRLAKTDPKHTKSFTRGGGFKGTAIKPHWAVWRATAEFGPVGIGWGWTVHETRIESGMVFCLVSVWYKHDGHRAETGQQWGGTSIMDGKREEVRAGNGRPDDESFKKSVTDGITKCLSCIGIGADVHLGQFDDSKYVEEITVEANAQREADAAARQLKLDEAFVIGAIQAIKAAKTLDELTSLGRGHAKKLKEIRERGGKHVELTDRYANEGRTLREKLAPPADPLPSETAAQAAE